MKRFSCFTLVVAMLAVYGVSFCFAKGGGGGHGGGGHSGGGHSGGEHHSSSEHHSSEHHSSEHHSDDHHSHEGHHDHHHVTHNGDHHAYDHNWNHYHPGAWGWGEGGFAWGNPWAPASYASAANWLGIPGQAYVQGDQEDGQVQPETIYPDQAQTGETQDNTAQPAANAKFMPLGVFTIAPRGDGEAIGTVQLNVSQDGQVRGSFYNFLTNRDSNIQGTVNKSDKSISWTVGPEGRRVFQTWLDVLTDPPGQLNVQGVGGLTREWTIARFTKQDENGSFEEAKKRIPNAQSSAN